MMKKMLWNPLSKTQFTMAYFPNEISHQKQIFGKSNLVLSADLENNHGEQYSNSHYFFLQILMYIKDTN